MQRVSICQLSTMRWSFFQDLNKYAAHGFDSVGVWRQKLEELDTYEAVELLHEMQMNVSSVHWAGAFTGSDGRSHLDAIEDAQQAIQLTRQLNADCLIVHSGSRNGHTYSHAQNMFESALQTLVPMANDWGVRLAVEPIPSQHVNDWSFYKTLDETLNLISQFSPTDVGLVIDLFHVGTNSEVFDTLHQFIDRVALVQLADREDVDSPVEYRRRLGKGIVPVRSWLRRLQQLGYQNAYEVELHGPGMNGSDYERRLRKIGTYLSSQSVPS